MAGERPLLVAFDQHVSQLGSQPNGACRSIKDCIRLACACLSEDSLTYKSTTAHAPNVAVYLPRNTSVASLAKCLNIPGFKVIPLCLERNILNQKFKSASLYLRISL